LKVLTVTVPTTQTSAYLAFEGFQTGTTTKGIADVAMTLHHSASIAVPSAMPVLLAGLETSVAGFSVTDLDNDSLTVRLTPVNGVLAVSVLPTGVGMIEEDDGGLTLTGTPRLLNLSLDSLTITAAAGAVSISATVADGDVLTTDNAAVAIAGEAAAAPTTAALPDGLVVSAGQVAGVSGITLSDIDSDQLTVALTASGGVLNFAADLA
jgi:hypothetical protein